MYHMSANDGATSLEHDVSGRNECTNLPDNFLGCDLHIFKSCRAAHSTRHAANSAAKRLGVNIYSILQTAGWSNASTFAKFYDRPLSRCYRIIFTKSRDLQFRHEELRLADLLQHLHQGHTRVPAQGRLGDAARLQEEDDDVLSGSHAAEAAAHLRGRLRRFQSLHAGHEMNR
ncbi:unnamed protein product [Trichogramma brassicae]|uniref:Uncharacterized protein n=1 Tax=Trichogramma brassicae TaxID=86971 RepID=A0A6H5I126_9HYME|nr:unnamed protein product [Trichogramma brassicae]